MAHASPARGVARRGGGPGPPKLGGRYGVLLLVLLALRTSRVRRRTTMLAGAVALIGSAAAVAADLTRTDVGYGAAEIWKALILLLTAVLIVRRVLDRPTVTLQSIYGALSAYLIIGLMFAAC